jgi:hypothetical protein
MWAEDNFFIYGKTCYFLQWQHFSNPMISKGVSNEKAWDIRDTITKADSNQKCDNRSKVSGLDEIYVCSCPLAELMDSKRISPSRASVIEARSLARKLQRVFPSSFGWDFSL